MNIRSIPKEAFCTKPPTEFVDDTVTLLARGMFGAPNHGPREQVVGTPGWLFTLLNAAMGPFDHDPAPNPRPKGLDSLAPGQKWGERNFLNPPFDNFEAWVDKAIEVLDKWNHETVLLAPFRPHSLWFFQKIICRNWPLFYVSGYVRFVGYKADLASPMHVVWFTRRPVAAWLASQRLIIMRPTEIWKELNCKTRASHEAACAEAGPEIRDQEGRVLVRGPPVTWDNYLTVRKDGAMPGVKHIRLGQLDTWGPRHTPYIPRLAPVAVAPKRERDDDSNEEDDDIPMEEPPHPRELGGAAAVRRRPRPATSTKSRRKK